MANGWLQGVHTLGTPQRSYLATTSTAKVHVGGEGRQEKVGNKLEVHLLHSLQGRN